MSKLRQKSDSNIDAAQVLIDNYLYASSVHCSYYSCFQLLKFTIKDFFEKDYEQQAVEISTMNQRTHQYVINLVASELIRLDSLLASRDFKRKIKDLKQFRIESDYENIEIDISKCQLAFRKAKEIRHYLITNFNV